MTPMFEAWLREAATELGHPELELTRQQQDAVLDLARAAAHGVARPAAPLTTFLAGYVLGAQGGLGGLEDLVARLSAAADARGAAASESGTDTPSESSN
jgi:phytoene dehydrogenase-like protein